MRLTNFLNELNKYKEIDHNILIDLLKKKCKNNLKSLINGKVTIYRGDDNFRKVGDIVLISPGDRISANTSNEYTILFSDVLSSWKKYPKRNHSIICSTDYKYADTYGTSYIIIPFDNTNVGICPSYDFWESFNNAFREILDFKSDSFLLTTLNDFLSYIKFENNINILEKKFSEIYSKYKNSNYYGIFMLDKLKSAFYDKSIYDVLNKYFSPEYNGFILKSNLLGLPEKREIWFDNQAIALHSEYFDLDHFRDYI